MPTLHYATTNTGKVHALKHAFMVASKLCRRRWRSPRSADDVQEIALRQARVAFAELGQPVVVMDAGFFIPSLKGFPGPYVNFALSTIGVTGLLRLTDDADRRCEFASAWPIWMMHTPSRAALAHIEGELARAPAAKCAPNSGPNWRLSFSHPHPPKLWPKWTRRNSSPGTPTPSKLLSGGSALQNGILRD
ncbi:MAG: non-canonical purine NTP pyrophosphatase [Caldilineaceae bacterium]